MQCYPESISTWIASLTLTQALINSDLAPGMFFFFLHPQTDLFTITTACSYLCNMNRSAKAHIVNGHFSTYSMAVMLYLPMHMSIIYIYCIQNDKLQS